MELDYVKLKDIKPALSGYINDSQILLKRSPEPYNAPHPQVTIIIK